MDTAHSKRHRATWRILAEARVEALEAEAEAAMQRRGLLTPDGKPVQVEDTAPPAKLWKRIVQRFGAPPSDMVAPQIAARERRALLLIYGQLMDHLDHARDYLRRGGRLQAWWRGSDVEGAWYNLHVAKALYIRLIPDADLVGRLPAIVTSLRAYLPPDHTQLVAVESRWKKVLDGTDTAGATRTVTWAEREELDGALRAAYEHNALKHQQVRRLRNIILTSSAATLLLVLGLMAVGMFRPSAVPLCFPDAPPAPTATARPAPQPQATQVTCPTRARAAAATNQDSRVPSGGDLALVALLGLVGASIATVRALSERTDAVTAYSLEVPRALLKAVTGALTAVLGLMFLRAGVVPGFTQLDTQSQILAYAVVFGYAQQILTGVIDTRAKNALQAASPTAPAAREGP